MPRESDGHRPRPSVLALAALSALTLGLVSVVSGCGGASAEADARVEATSGLLTVKTHPATLQEGFTISREHRGQVEPRRRSQIGFDLAGVVTMLRVDEGDRVERGALLARLDTDRLAARERELEAAIAEASARVALAESTLERFERAAKRQAVSPQDLDEARQNLAAQKAALSSTEARRELIAVDLEKSRLYAPYAALVTQRRVDEGQVVAPGTIVLELIEVEAPRVRIGVPIDQARELEADTDAVVRVAGQTFPARQLSVLPEQSSRTRSVDLLLELEARLGAEAVDGQVRAGETAILSLDRTLPGTGFVLPISALTESSRGLWSCLVAVPSDDDPAIHILDQRPIEVIEVGSGTTPVAGAAPDSTTTLAFVRGGLEEGEQVVTEGLQRLVAGQKVTTSTSRPAAHPDSASDSNTDSYPEVQP